MSRTYSRADWLAAQAAWEEGEFSPEWKPWRHRAAMDLGIIFPPAGDRFDSFEDDRPSQRAILIRAIRETPQLLSSCLTGSRSWSDVIGKLTKRRDLWREDQRASEIRQPADDVPTDREATMTLKAILERIEQS